MALDNIQKSILGVLGISCMAAFLTPTSPKLANNSKQLPDMQDKQASQENLVPVPERTAPQVPEQQKTSAYVPGAAMPAFGEPTISGLPYGQSPATNTPNKDQPNLPVDEQSATSQNGSANQILSEGTSIGASNMTENSKTEY